MKFINRIGEENVNFQGCKMKIVEYNDACSVIVEFQDEYRYRKKCAYKGFKNGSVKNPYDKTVYGIGYLGEGEYNKKNSLLIYTEWQEMLKRCYDPYFINKQLTYKDCYVEKDLHCFQNFVKWWKDNEYKCNGEKLHLDKDILVKGNKIYSKERMMLVPQRINNLFTKRQNYRGELPIGCTFRPNKKIQASCDNGNTKVYLGVFDDKRSAWLMYKINKELVIQSVADEYKDLIPKKLYDALYEYKVEIND